jgi:hypothetical protein
MDRSFWSKACNASVSRALQEVEQANYIANGIAVRVNVDVTICYIKN